MSFTYEITAGEVTVTGYQGTVSYLQVPPEIEGLPVRRIKNSAFSRRNDLRQVFLPDSLQTLSRFAFYSCPNLTSVTMYDSVTDYADGVFRLCGALRDVYLTLTDNRYGVLREILTDIEGKLRIHLTVPGREACLIFPDYLVEYEEDTFVRVIHSSIVGSGFSYRECISRAGVDYREYDSLFARTRLQDAHLATEIACERLCRPCELREKPRDMYREFLRENGSEALRMAVTEKREDWLRMMLEQDLPDAAARGNAAQLAAERGETGMVALLMKQRPQRSRKRLEL